jgi:hypothetical protein
VFGDAMILTFAFLSPTLRPQGKSFKIQIEKIEGRAK